MNWTNKRKGDEMSNLDHNGDLRQISREIRKLTVKCIGSLGVGHIGGSLSIVDLLTVLYYKIMKFDPTDPRMEGRDRFVCSKGHAGPAVYATLANLGFFPTSELSTLNRIHTNLPSHCDMNKTPGIDMTTGSLGQGLSCGVGLALGSKIRGDDAKIYVVIGDGESQEGQIWEAAMFASHNKLDNLFLFVDNNHMQIDGTVEEISDSGSFAGKFAAFGFNTYTVDGHDHEAIEAVIRLAQKKIGRPHAIILETVKGKGVSFVEAAKVGCHSMPLTKENIELALKELGGE